MIHILYYGLATSRHVGGIETYLLKILNHIDLSLFQIDFLMSKGCEPCFYNEFLSLGCKFHFVTSRRESVRKNRLEICNLLKEQKFDIVHCHLNSLSYITPCIEACKQSIPVVVHSHNAAIMASPVSRMLHRFNYYRLQKLDVTRVAVSDLAGKWMFGKKPFVVLNNGINMDRFTFSETDRFEIRKLLNIEKDREVFVNVGKFRPQKNHKFTIHIFAEYLKQNPSALLLLVGDGELIENAKSLVGQLHINDNVRFLGVRNDIPQILSASDKLLFPSFYEGFPCALIEAECNGLYCVVSDSITKQAVVKDFSEQISLDAPVEQWCSAMSRKKSFAERALAPEVIKELGLDVDSEIQRLSDLYKQVIC